MKERYKSFPTLMQILIMWYIVQEEHYTEMHEQKKSRDRSEEMLSKR